MCKWLICAVSVLLLSTPAWAAWKWVDSNGVVHYSDQPVPGAEEVDLPGATTSSLTRPSRSSLTTPSRNASSQGQNQAAEQQPAARSYRRLDIVSPQPQQTFWNIGGTIDVQVAIEPALQAGHTIDVLYDGQPRGLQATSPQLTLNEVFRGIHTIQAMITDSNGNVLNRSAATTFMVQQTSLLNPNNPQRQSPNNTPVNNAGN